MQISTMTSFPLNVYGDSFALVEIFVFDSNSLCPSVMFCQILVISHFNALSEIIVLQRTHLFIFLYDPVGRM